MTHGNAERCGEGGGVSPSTVSYTLRGGAYVSQETAEQICAIIERNKNTAPVDILH
ncbi:helix-turn-helix domain-containing protein [Bifidobacterium bifidum]|uniref:helix-turn-helix domain-containing protein n=1 Tax=Bifidobacterium bifidum TaxID=1681 RepID=UPI00216ACBE3|nr:LacI family DNA-binding transcriptional regulator [Bifidobacterium bifidum]